MCSLTSWSLAMYSELHIIANFSAIFDPNQAQISCFNTSHKGLLSPKTRSKNLIFKLDELYIL